MTIVDINEILISDVLAYEKKTGTFSSDAGMMEKS